MTVRMCMYRPQVTLLLGRSLKVLPFTSDTGIPALRCGYSACAVVTVHRTFWPKHRYLEFQ